MKKILTMLLAAALTMTALSGCAAKDDPTTTAPTTTPETTQGVVAPKNTTITVVTSYGGDDGNRLNYEAAYKAYEAASGNKVNDASGTSNEEWKAKIMTDFQTGAEPDVLFYFNGVDSNAFVQAGKVVSIDTIRATYPEYASNMKDSMLGASPVDGKNYSIPVNGYWEGLFVNKKVLNECGVAIPGADYTWDQFLADCATIAAKGYAPIAASLQEVPHYWFEYTVFNNGTLANHAKLPTSSTDEQGKSWAAGLNDIKDLYTKGFFPKNTLTAGDADTFQMMADDQAAFAIDGSWKLGWFQTNVGDRLDDYTVTYIPGKNSRKATDIIGGLSMGYYITQKAWNDPDKQAAAVKFVETMTNDSVVSLFGATAITALKNGTTPPAGADSLVQAALAMTKGSTGIVSATQDNLLPTARAALFADVKNIVTDGKTAEKAVDDTLALNK